MSNYLRVELKTPFSIAHNINTRAKMSQFYSALWFVGAIPPISLTFVTHVTKSESALVNEHRPKISTTNRSIRQSMIHIGADTIV